MILEFALLALMAYLLLGPQDFAKLARKLTEYKRQFSAITDGLREQIASEVDAFPQGVKPPISGESASILPAKGAKPSEAA